jgi:hypothetical protein
MRWAGYVARMGDQRDAYRFWWRGPRQGEHLEDVHVDVRIILKFIFKKCDEEPWS